MKVRIMFQPHGSFADVAMSHVPRIGERVSVHPPGDESEDFRIQDVEWLVGSRDEKCPPVIVHLKGIVPMLDRERLDKLARVIRDYTP